MTAQRPLGGVAEFRRRFEAEFRCHARRVVVGKEGNVVRSAFAQGRHEEHLETQAVEQIGLELTRLCHRPQVGVGRGDEAHVHRNGFAGPHPLESAVLDHAQDFFLHGHGHLPDFVEKKRAAVRRLEPTRRRRAAPVNAPAS